MSICSSCSTRPFNIANRLFGQAGYDFEQPFLEITDRDFVAPLEPVDFWRDPEAARLRINEWVEDQTNGKIGDLLPEGAIKESTRLVLTNAVHFDGSWKYKFDEAYTRDETFYQSGGESQVFMMRQQQSFQFAELPGFQILEMPYAGDDLSLVAMLPTERDGLGDLEASLTPDLWTSGVAALRETQVVVTFPKFTFNSSFKLADSLQAMGMTDAFEPKFSNLTGIAPPQGELLFIDEILQKAFIDVNEEGTEAAASTAAIIGSVTVCFCPPPPPKEFRADHPFLFAIRDRHSGSLLFMGRVTDPGKLVAASTAIPEPLSLALLLVGAIFSLTLRRRAWIGR